MAKLVAARTDRQNEGLPPSQALWYGLFVLGIAILAVAGYIGYELYPRFDLPPAEQAAHLRVAR